MNQQRIRSGDVFRQLIDDFVVPSVNRGAFLIPNHLHGTEVDVLLTLSERLLVSQIVLIGQTY